MKVFLIGLPGSGKSTLGPKLAEAMNLPFFDLDHEIEKRTSKSVSEIFSLNGEDYFRKIENSTLVNLNKSKSDFLLATGGGTPCFFDAMQWMNDQGVTIYLDTDLSTIIKRLKNKTDRPLLVNEDLEEKLTKLHSDRINTYRQCKLTWSQREQLLPLYLLAKEIKNAV